MGQHMLVEDNWLIINSLLKRWCFSQQRCWGFKRWPEQHLPALPALAEDSLVHHSP